MSYPIEITKKETYTADGVKTEKQLVFYGYEEECRQAIILAITYGIDRIDYIPSGCGSCSDRDIFCRMFDAHYMLESYERDDSQRYAKKLTFVRKED